MKKNQIVLFYLCIGALIGLDTQVANAVSSADLAKAEEFAEDAQTMMDNQLGNIYTDMKTSVVCFQYNTVYTTSYMYHVLKWRQMLCIFNIITS